MTKESFNSSRTPSDGHPADTNPNSAQTLAASCSQPVLTLSQGAPVSDTASSQTLGQNGPVLLQDVDFIEKLAHFHRERIPERVVHAKGSGAFGTFRPYRSMGDYSTDGEFCLILPPGRKGDVLSSPFSKKAGAHRNGGGEPIVPGERRVLYVLCQLGETTERRRSCLRRLRRQTALSPGEIRKDGKPLF